MFRCTLWPERYVNVGSKYQPGLRMFLRLRLDGKLRSWLSTEGKGAGWRITGTSFSRALDEGIGKGGRSSAICSDESPNVKVSIVSWKVEAFGIRRGEDIEGPATPGKGKEGSIVVWEGEAFGIRRGEGLEDPERPGKRKESSVV